MINTIKIIGLALLVTVTYSAIGQSSFNYSDDFKKILAKSKDPDDPLSYDKLLKRFNANDTTLTDYEVLSLLIGYTDKPEFKPYAYLDTERKIYDINDEEKFKEALDSANVFLSTHPLSVKVLFEKGYSLHKLGQEDSAAFYTYKGHRIFQAMLFSGNGKTPETPTFALGPADGQDYIRKYFNARIGIMGSGEDKNGNFLDILEVVPKDGSSYNLYFIIQHATDKMFSAEDLKNMENLFKEIDNKDKKDKKSKKNK